MTRALFSAFLLVFMSSPAFAWGQTGHRVTGMIAEHYLTKRAKKEIEAILGPESLAEASTWPDFMRASPDPFWRKEAGSYHYVTVPPGKTYSDVGAPPEGDAVTALQKFAKTLKDPSASRQDKALALRFTVHIIGDLHQPLHVGNGEDRGGNDVKLAFYGEPSNLHSVWDSGMIDREGLSYSELGAWIEEKITAQEAKEWLVADPLQWIRESGAIRETIYPQGSDIGRDYSFKYIETVHERLAMGGVRIAAYLNALYSK